MQLAAWALMVLIYTGDGVSQNTTYFATNELCNKVAVMIVPDADVISPNYREYHFASFYRKAYCIPTGLE